MLNEEIGCSREVKDGKNRELEEKRRATEELSKANNELLRRFYNACSDDQEAETTTLTTQQYEGNFDIFADQMILAVADNLDYVQANERRSKRAVIVTSSQNFQTCEEFATQELEQWHEASAPDALYATEQSQAVFNATLSPQTPPKATKSIVEQILEDFCSSPPSPGEVALQEILKRYADDAPNFQFRHVALRTYSRKRPCKSKKCLTPQPNITKFNENSGDSLSLVSSLSHESPLFEGCDEPDRTLAFSENMQNLSSSFPEPSHAISAAVKSEPDQETEAINTTKIADPSSQPSAHTPPPRMKQLMLEQESELAQLTPIAANALKEVLSLRQQYPISWIRLCNKSESLDEFLGFSLESPMSSAHCTVDDLVKQQTHGT